MKNIYYTLPNFHKALRRNSVSYVYCNDVTDEFWFVTQKAIINYSAKDSKDLEVLRIWFVTHGIEVKYVFS